ncbi:MAG: 2-isopropylmalate synthase [Candidatus Omnitrophota bacterium]
MSKIIIFDTTLRDGEQSPGASLNLKEKVEIGRQLAALKVDVIEAGFPVSSPGDFASVREVARIVNGPVICGLARSVKKDIDAVYNTVKYSERPRIHVFLATSSIHRRYKLKKAKDEILKLATWAVRYAKSKLPDVEFSPEDASRTEKEFLFEVIEAVIDGGATTVNIPDTVGYATPYEFGSLIKNISERVSNIGKATISVHCHNDLGLGVANSLAAVLNGARQIECTINGIGERAGNASLEEIVMAIKTRRDIFAGKKITVRTKELYKTSRLVSRLTGVPVQPNKAIVGMNAFAHEAGIHQDGILKERRTYEIMKPADIGFGESRLVLGKHSGRHAFQERLKKLGFSLERSDLDEAFKTFKDLADKKKSIFDDDLVSIVEENLGAIPEKYGFLHFNVASGDTKEPNAEITLRSQGKIVEANSSGDGPVDACYKAVDKITGIKGKLLDYQLRAVTGGKDALGEVMVRIDSKGSVVSGRGTSTDIIEASLKAYINAMNKFAFLSKKKR